MHDRTDANGGMRRHDPLRNRQMDLWCSYNDEARRSGSVGLGNVLVNQPCIAFHCTKFGVSSKSQLCLVP